MGPVNRGQINSGTTVPKLGHINMKQGLEREGKSRREPAERRDTTWLWGNRVRQAATAAACFFVHSSRDTGSSAHIVAAALGSYETLQDSFQ